MRLWLFLSSYSPLFLILGLRLFPELQGGLTWSLVVPGAFIFVAIVGFCALIWLLRGLTRKQQLKVVVNDVVDEGGNLSAYLISYLFPFVYSEVGDWRDMAVFVIFGLLILVIGVRSDMALFNPLVVVFGWRVIKLNVCELIDGRSVECVRYAIVKGSLYAGVVEARKFADGYAIGGCVK